MLLTWSTVKACRGYVVVSNMFSVSADEISGYNLLRFAWGAVGIYNIGSNLSHPIYRWFGCFMYTSSSNTEWYVFVAFTNIVISVMYSYNWENPTVRDWNWLDIYVSCELCCFLYMSSLETRNTWKLLHIGLILVFVVCT